MLPADLDELLTRTLDDRRLSRKERQSLAEVFRGLDPGADRRAALARAFAVARGVLADERDAEVLAWLEEVTPLLLAEDPRKAVPASEALFSPGDACPRRINSLLDAARQRVDLCVFTITDDRISGAILEAYRRGVALRIVTDNDKAQDEGSDIDRFREAGIPVRFDRTEYHMHHKFALFDGSILLTGSYNWTRGASQFNDENLIVTREPGLVAAFGQAFERIWTRLA